MVGTLAGGGRCARLWSDLELTYDLVIVTMSFNILPGLFLGFHKVKKVNTSGHWFGGAGVHPGVTFNFGFSKVCLLAIFEKSFSYDKDTWIATTDYYVHFYIILLFPLIAILQQINFTAS